MVILGLDYGTKRIGVAKTDALGMMAHPLLVLERKNDAQLLAELKEIVLKCQVTRIVVGLPKNLKGEMGKSAQAAQAFGQWLEKSLPDMEFVYWDERFSSAAVERTLTEMNISSRKQRGQVDKLAAQWMLEGYLHSLKTNPRQD